MSSVLTDLPAGHIFEPVRFTISPERARAYRDAVGDSLSFYDQANAVAPLALAASALGALLESVSLPDGTLHVNESVSFLAPVAPGAEVECQARLTQRSQRAGFVVSILETEVLHDGGPVLRARATVMSPGAGS